MDPINVVQLYNWPSPEELFLVHLQYASTESNNSLKHYMSSLWGVMHIINGNFRNDFLIHVIMYFRVTSPRPRSQYGLRASGMLMFGAI